MSDLKKTLREATERVADAATRKGLGVFRCAQASGSVVNADGSRLAYIITVRAVG